MSDPTAATGGGRYIVASTRRQPSGIRHRSSGGLSPGCVRCPTAKAMGPHALFGVVGPHRMGSPPRHCSIAVAHRRSSAAACPPTRMVVERAGKPDPVHRVKRMGGHLSRPTIARRLMHPTRSFRTHRRKKPTARRSARRVASCCLFGLAGGGVYPAADVTARAVRSYRTISPLPTGSCERGGRYLFCGTIPRLTPGWRYQPPYPAQSGLSSRPQTRAKKPMLMNARPPSPTPPTEGLYRRASQRATVNPIVWQPPVGPGVVAARAGMAP